MIPAKSGDGGNRTHGGFPPKDETPGVATCAFCGEPATHEKVELAPPETKSDTIIGRNGLPMPGQRLARAAVLRDLCDTHYAVYERNKGWQERQRKEREERALSLYGDLKKNQLDLFADQEAA